MTTKPKYDFFLDEDGIEYIVEVFSACDGVVEEYSIFPLQEDGSKGPLASEDFHEKHQDLVNERYYDHLENSSYIE